ncbi:MAG: tyrosine-protein phosphatase, partial [Angelakisella sp.]
MQTATNSLEMKSKNGNYQRRILIPGIDNLRDLGGYPTADGRYVRWGCFYRSAAITPRDAEARALFDKLHIKTILDYRAKTEIGAAVDYLPEGAKYYLLPAIPANEAGEVDQQGNLDMVTMIRNIRTPQQADEMYCYFRQIYAELPFHNPSYHKMFAAMDGLDSVPFIQHCSAGKDRTGVGCA